jgi:tetratricopeptide (TPR) repeat protein
MNQERLAKLLQMLEVNKTDAFLTYAIGLEYLGDSDTENAIDWFSKTLEINTEHVASLYQMALVYSSLDQTETACKFLERGLIILQNSSDNKTKNEFRSLLDELLY